MMSAAYVDDDRLMLLGQHMEVVERHRRHATKFQMVAEVLRAVQPLVAQWDTLSDRVKDILRHLVMLLMPTQVSRLAKMRAALEFGLLALRLGPDEVVKQVMDFAAARQEFIDAVLDAEERSNAALQAHLADCISSGLTDETRTVVPMDQVGEWFRRLPS